MGVAKLYDFPGVKSFVSLPQDSKTPIPSLRIQYMMCIQRHKQPWSSVVPDFGTRPHLVQPGATVYI